MAKMATVHAQQMWEYMSITRKTEDFLVTELNEIGKLGWELVAAAYHKDLKSLAGTYCWTAVLKRPLVVPGHAKASEEAHGAEPPSESPSEAQQADASIFDVQQPEEEEESVLGGPNGPPA